MKIAVASGKGGTGKTFFSTNLFAAMRQSGLEVVMIDCDAEVPDDALFLPGTKIKEIETRQFCPTLQQDACKLCGQCARNCVFNAITCIPALHYITVHEDLCHGCGACLHECPHGAIHPGWKSVGTVSFFAPETLRKTGKETAVPANDETPYLIVAQMNAGEHSPVPVIRAAQKEADKLNPEFQILDAPPGCTCPFVNTVMDADRVILVTEPTPFGLSDLQHTVEILREIGKDFCVVINRSDLGNDQMKTWLAGQGISVLAEIPYSDEIASCYADGRMVVDTQASFKDMFEKIVEKIVNDENSSC